jgi:hypothetical protein
VNLYLVSLAAASAAVPGAAALTFRLLFRRRAWVTTARALGIEQLGPFHLRGRVGPQPMEIVRTAPQGTIEIRVQLDPPLDLGLSANKLPRPTADRDELKRALGVNADEARRLKGLFAGDLQSAVLHALAHVRDLRLSDDAVLLVLDANSNAERILAQARAALELADVVDAQRGRVPLADAVQPFKKSWQELADDLRMRICTTPFGFEGKLDGVHARCVAIRRNATERAAAIRVTHPAPLPHAARVTSIGKGKSFEESFRVEPQAAGEWLNEAVRAKLVELAQTGEVELTELYVGWIGSTDAAALRERLQRCRSVVTTLSALRSTLW